MDSIETPSSSSPPKSNGPGTSTTAAARRAKKREQDRRCQRMLRERTKNRIAYLEGLLADFERQGTSATVQALRKERDEAVEDRDRLIQALRTINRVIKASHPSLAGTSAIDTSRSAVADQQPPERTDAADSGDSNPVKAGAIPGPTLPASGTPDLSEVHADSELPEPASNLTVNVLDPIWLAQAFDEISSATGGASIFTASSDTAQPTSSAFVPTLPTDTCECSPRPSDQVIRPFNLWRFANDTLAEPIPWSNEISEVEDALAEDIPVRAVAESWDAAAQSVGGILPPSWQQLRKIDETLFSRCGDTERLAIMKTMHSLLVAHADTTLERRARLPDWYIARPSQTMAHSAATDYFTWPGVRERFVFHPHRYCSNKFWSTFTKSFRILWPYEFRDCYTRSTQTGRYNISPTFQGRINDLRAFTMGEDMFQIWPELRSDIPAFETMGMSLSPGWLGVPQSAGQQKHVAFARHSTMAIPANGRRKTHSVPSKDGLVPEEEEDSGNDAHALQQRSEVPLAMTEQSHYMGGWPAWEALARE
ncbi:uncharacterized protein B0I36DRAFT_436248 [Microdochium trichocladiopsis]|uniref:BZIP transcription factor n=1 Tax=Microdochium trichocladiopsis TaxID=1682393 RepID=A0A9P8XRJ3_9PEZI|nr:uncharacterized protein B0I36DRAFT_436248 [Microdochium trichocladiopsis]KAH7014165.1 hypothetical protein B0I36DRAFT_436248 [Microdochium trichocladiopsis]